MLRTIAVLLLAIQAQVFTGGYRKVMSSGSCTPSVTNSWAAWTSGTLCTGSVACTNSAGVINVAPAVGAVSATQSSGTGYTPTYVSSGLNSLPTMTFAGPSGTNYLNIGSTVMNITTGAFTLYAVIKVGAYGGGVSFNSAIFGSSAPGGIEWRIDAGTYKQHLLKGYIADVATGTNSYTAGAWIAIAVEFNPATGAYAFFSCSGGTCSSDGSGTVSAVTFSHATDVIGMMNGDDYFADQIAEVQYYNGTSIANFGCYVKTKYNI